jgi:hypothetical protein
MARYEQNGISFDPPPDWIDRTIVAYAAPAPPGAKNAPNLVMTEEPLRAKDTLRTHADRQLMEFAQQLEDFRILETRETLLGGVPAIAMRFTWNSQFGAMEQTLTIAERTVAAGRVVVSFTSTALAEDAVSSRPVFAELLRTVRIAPTARGHAAPPEEFVPVATGRPDGNGSE